jgi:hypothetical protein
MMPLVRDREDLEFVLLKTSIMVPERGDVNLPILDLFILVGKLQEIIEQRRLGFCGSTCSRLHGMRIS